MPIAVLNSDYAAADHIVAPYMGSVRDAIAMAVAAERERCAQTAEHLNGWGEKPNPELATHIAKAIRGL